MSRVASRVGSRVGSRVLSRVGGGLIDTRAQFDLNFAAGKFWADGEYRTLAEVMDYTRAGDGTYWDDTGTLQTASTDMLRFDHDPATGEFRGVLVEEAATNYSDRSKLSGATFTGWTVTEIGTGTIVAEVPDFTAISDVQTALCTVAVDDRAFLQRDFSLNPSTTYELSFYTADVSAFAGTGGRPVIIFGDVAASDSSDASDLSDNTINSVTFTTDATASPSVTVRIGLGAASNSGESGFFEFGVPQIEERDFATSRILTDGTAVTRPDDVLTQTFSENSGTLSIVGQHKGGDGVLWQADDGTENNRHRIEVSGGDVIYRVTDGGTEQAAVTLGALSSSGVYKVAVRFDTNDIAGSLDGATAVTDTTATIPTVTTARFGADTAGAEGVNWFKTTTFYDELKTDAELEAKTA